jgi:hypothetical protein
MAAMQRVELEDEHDVVEADVGADGARPRRRRGLVAVAAGVLVLALGLVAAQSVLDARERARVAAWGDLPGTVRPLGDALTAGWSFDALSFPASISRDEALGSDVAVGSRIADDGSVDAVATRLPDGAELWSTRIDGPVAARTGGDTSGGAQCGRAQPATGPLVCFVTDHFSTWDDGYEVLHEGTRAEVVVLDPIGGTEARRWDVPLSDGFTVLGSLAVVWTVAPDGTVELRAYDVATGREAWSRTFAPPPGLDVEESVGALAWVYAAGDVLQVHQAMRAAPVVLDADGEAVPVPSGVDDVMQRPGEDTWYFSGSRGSQVITTRVGPDGAEVEVEGSLVSPVVDDGSLGDLFLTDLAGLTAWDAATGRERWTGSVSLDGSVYGSVVVLGGRVYALSGADVVALDGSTGEERWRRTVLDDPLYASIATDGARLYTVSNGFPDGGGNQQRPEITAISFEGDDVRTIPLPEGTGQVVQFGPYLWSRSVDGPRVGSLLF